MDFIYVYDTNKQIAFEEAMSDDDKFNQYFYFIGTIQQCHTDGLVDKEDSNKYSTYYGDTLFNIIQQMLTTPSIPDYQKQIAVYSYNNLARRVSGEGLCITKEMVQEVLNFIGHLAIETNSINGHDLIDLVMKHDKPYNEYCFHKKDVTLLDICMSIFLPTVMINRLGFDYTEKTIMLSFNTVIKSCAFYNLVFYYVLLMINNDTMEQEYYIDWLSAVIERYCSIRNIKLSEDEEENLSEAIKDVAEFTINEYEGMR